MYLRNKYLDCSSPHFRLQAHFSPADKNTCGANDRGPWQLVQTQCTHHPAAGAGALTTWVFGCHCVRRCQTLAEPIGEGVLIGSSMRRAEYVGTKGDRRGAPRLSRLGQRIHQRPRRVDACEFSLSSAFYTELCLKAQRCASTPWLTFVWSLTALLLTKRGPTISGWHTLGRSPTHDLAL